MMLSVDKINVFYGDVQVLYDVSLNIEKGEIVCLLGANAAGKTTTIKTVSGILHPKSGLITLRDKRTDKLASHAIVDLGIVQVPEGRLLFPLMSVAENLEMGAYIRRAREKRHDTMEWVFQLFPILKERKTQLAGTLSGGEQQMLAVGRSLMTCPEVLMLDEPSLGLAPKVVLQTFDTIKKVNEEGVTILLVEQNITHALRLANRGYILENGAMVLEGKSEELLDNEHVKKAYLGM